MLEGGSGTMRPHLPTVFSSAALSVLALLLCLGLLSSFGLEPPPQLSKAVQRQAKLQARGPKAKPKPPPKAPKAGPKAVRHFVYLCPPKTGSLVTRGELRRFGRREGLKVLGQNEPCTAMSHCPLNSTLPAVREELETVFWAAFTKARLEHCCPKALATQFDGAIFHPYLADPPTREFFRTHTPEDALWFTILRNPVDQFISFFNWVTRKHRHLYRRYMPLLEREPPLELEATVALWHKHLLEERMDQLPPGHLHLYRTINNIQSRILGWDGTPASLRETLASLDRMAFVGLTEEIRLTWQLLRKRLGWPKEYLSTSLLRKPTTRGVEKTLERRILDLQAADAKLYQRARTKFYAFAKATPRPKPKPRP